MQPLSIQHRLSHRIRQTHDCISAADYFTSDTGGNIGRGGENVVACPAGTYETNLEMTGCVECGWVLCDGDRSQLELRVYCMPLPLSDRR